MTILTIWGADMGAPKPCLGYPSRTAAVVGLRGNGLNTRQIAEAIGIAEKTVIALEIGSSRPVRERRPSEQLGRTVVIPVGVLSDLERHAAKRCISVNHLVRLIVSTVSDEGMVDAVLDDADEVAELLS